MKSILIVDDEHTVVESLAEILAWEGYHVVCAPDGVVGERELASRVPDLVLLDYMMPGRDGLEVLATIRSDPRLAPVRVVMMSAAPMAINGVAPGWDALLRKPFTLARLLELVQGLIGPGLRAGSG